MISRLFPILFDMSLSASVLIAAVLLLRLFWHRFPRRYILLLWAVVLLRLLCPIQPESNLSIIPTQTVSFAQNTTVEERTAISTISAANAALRAVGDAANGGLDTIYVELDRAESTNDTSPTASLYHDQVWLLFLEKIFPIGIIFLLLRQFISALRLRRYLKTAVPCTDTIPESIPDRKYRVFAVDGIPSAFVLGLFRPTIYLPSDLPRDTVIYALAHECVHIRRRDLLWKTLAFCALCLHWYNPLVWAAYCCASADIEYSCDEAAVLLLQTHSDLPVDDLRTSYAQALLSASSERKNRIYALSLSAGNVSRRIRRLLQSKPKKVFSVMLLVCCIIFCLLGIGNPPTDFDANLVRMCTLDGTSVSPQHGAALVEALNDASRTVNRFYDAIGEGPLDHTTVVTFADGSYLQFNYLYVSEFPFHPAHPGEDDYKTIVWYRQPNGVVKGTWIMEYDFDAIFRDWIIAAVQTPDHGSVIVHAPSDSEIGLAALVISGRRIADIPLLPVAYDKPLDYDRLPVVTVREDAVIQITGIGSDHLRVGEDYYENRGSSTVIDQQTLTPSAGDDGSFSLPVMHRNPNREESAVYYIAAEEMRYCFQISFVPTAKLTIDDVIALSAKGMDLTWEDFAGYKFTETGSGLYIRVYEIDEVFSLWIGGATMGTPMYIYLARADDLDTRIDIRSGGVEEFITDAGYAQSSLLKKTRLFLKQEFHRVYDPHYDILTLSILDWTETGTEAIFLYTMSFQYRDEQFSDLSPSKINYYFKVTENGDTLDLYCNFSPTGVKWEPCKIDDFVTHH